MFIILQIIALLAFTAQGSTHVFEFCADNQLFEFSYEACPGGVLLKNPLELTESCGCVNKHLTVYSPCETPSLDENRAVSPPKACKRMGSRSTLSHEAVLIKLIQPYGSIFSDSHKDSKCERVLSTCFRNSSTSIISRLPQFDNHIPALKIEPEYPQKLFSSPEGRVKRNTNEIQHSQSHRQKRDLSQIADETVRNQVQDTIDFLNELQTGTGSGTIKKPKSLTFQMLAKTVEIFNSITPREIIEDETTNSILSLFFKKYQMVEGPSYSGRLLIDDSVDKLIFEDIMSRLHECASKASDASQEFEFRSETGMCPVSVTHVIDKVSRPDASVKKRLLPLKEFMPQDRRYVPHREDFLLGALWKMFDSVYSYCFPYLFAYHNAQALIYYFNYMENIFVSPFVVQDFVSSSGNGTSSYSSKIEHEDLRVLMDNIDSMNEAVHMLGQFKNFLSKPMLDKLASSEPHDGRTEAPFERWVV
ncbi:unnamed protein product [Orchesella dallaii]|uniref:RGS domain-containing protein n=1 Tax=Orchesella dallaii TaxID=48710 RepID=A0ABP1QWY6_9HEXA